MDVTWLVDEYLGNGKARHAAFSSKRRAIEVAGKRYVITFRQLGEDSDETIRSERTDGRRGKDVMQLWGRDLKNHICILFKHNEESKDPSKSGGFRVAPYVIDLGLQKN